MKKHGIILIVVFCGAFFGALAALSQRETRTYTSSSETLAPFDLQEDARAVPPWPALRSLKWYQYPSALTMLKSQKIMSLEGPLLTMLNDDSLPTTTRYTASYLLEQIALTKALEIAGSPKKAKISASQTWMKAREFQYRTLLESDYTTAIDLLRTTVNVMKLESMTTRDALAALHSAGWEIVSEDETALRAAQ